MVHDTQITKIGVRFANPGSICQPGFDLPIRVAAIHPQQPEQQPFSLRSGLQWVNPSWQKFVLFAPTHCNAPQMLRGRLVLGVRVPRGRQDQLPADPGGQRRRSAVDRGRRLPLQERCVRPELPTRFGAAPVRIKFDNPVRWKSNQTHAKYRERSDLLWIFERLQLSTVTHNTHSNSQSRVKQTKP